jgi:hypothetical protein
MHAADILSHCVLSGKRGWSLWLAHSPVTSEPSCMHECGRSLIVLCPSETLTIYISDELHCHIVRGTVLGIAPNCQDVQAKRDVFVTLIKYHNFNYAVSSAIPRLEEATQHHWPTSSNTRLRCRVCSSRGKRRYIRKKWLKCDVGLYISGCFQQYLTKAQEGSLSSYKAGAQK